MHLSLELVTCSTLHISTLSRVPFSAIFHLAKRCHHKWAGPCANRRLLVASFLKKKKKKNLSQSVTYIGGSQKTPSRASLTKVEQRTGTSSSPSSSDVDAGFLSPYTAESQRAPSFDGGHTIQPTTHGVPRMKKQRTAKRRVLRAKSIHRCPGREGIIAIDWFQAVADSVNEHTAKWSSSILEQRKYTSS